LALKVNTGGNQAGACAANCGQNAHFSLLFLGGIRIVTISALNVSRMAKSWTRSNVAHKPKKNLFAT